MLLSAEVLAVHCKAIFLCDANKNKTPLFVAKHGRDMTEDRSNNMPARPMLRPLNIGTAMSSANLEEKKLYLYQIDLQFNILFAQFFAAMD